MRDGPDATLTLYVISKTTAYNFNPFHWSVGAKKEFVAKGYARLVTAEENNGNSDRYVAAPTTTVLLEERYYQPSKAYAALEHARDTVADVADSPLQVITYALHRLELDKTAPSSVWLHARDITVNRIYSNEII